MSLVQRQIEEIRKLLWEDHAEKAFALAKELAEQNPSDSEVIAVLKEVTQWLSHIVSPEAYANFYQAHRRSFVAADQMPHAHERIPRLGQIRSWILDRPPQTILDLGCFDGFALINLCMATGAQGVGVDLDQEALKHASQAAVNLDQNIRWVHDMAEKIDLEMKFDAVLVMELLEHVIDPKKLLLSAEKHLAPGGRVYITTPATPVPHFENEKEAREHLRCLNDEQLFALIGDRAVDHHTQLQPAHHKERVLCYRRPKTKIFVNPISGGWSPDNSVTYRGSEEGVAMLANQLGNNGHEVELYYNDVNPQRESFTFADVLWAQHDKFDPTDACDILIIKKYPQLLDLDLGAARVILSHATR